MNGRSGRPSRAAAPDPHGSQVGFYLLPPDYPGLTHKSSKKKSHSRRSHGGGHGGHLPPGGGNPRKWASHNQLDVITEASDESRPASPSGRNQGPAWNSSPGENGFLELQSITKKHVPPVFKLTFFPYISGTA